ncbi:hypothetical protein KC19_2G229000 [Ceratodon purpureus]|uniref:Uncharacterized protein n=1 Tax=Ceratodon purpureus TaxID=3225 RepID=A0A8T0IWZ9_CERPU|nr:hypothetical protein KC19_2G229000 [Ceratodon purpureus]
MNGIGMSEHETLRLLDILRYLFSDRDLQGFSHEAFTWQKMNIRPLKFYSANRGLIWYHHLVAASRGKLKDCIALARESCYHPSHSSETAKHMDKAMPNVSQVPVSSPNKIF